MKKIIKLTLCMLVAGAFLVGGCSSTKFEKYDGSPTPAGNVGEVDSVDGIDFWRNGQPNRQYLILGVIEQSHHHRLPLGRLSRAFSSPGDSENRQEAREDAIAKVAHKNGGDAVILVAETPEFNPDTDSATDESYGHHRHQEYTLIVVRYVQ
jgi:hypothetical protein